MTPDLLHLYLFCVSVWCLWYYEGQTTAAAFIAALTVLAIPLIVIWNLVIWLAIKWDRRK